MKKICIKIVSVLLAVLLMSGSLNVYALNFNGTTSAGGDGSSTTASSGGYAVPNMIVNNSNRAVGYRFSVCNATGNVACSPRDVFRQATWKADGVFYAGYYKFDSKKTKTELKSIYTTTAFSTSATTAGCLHDSDMKLTLPETTAGLQAWCTEYNISTCISYMWGVSVNTLLKNGWAVLIEPIFPVKIQGTYHSLTPTEIAVYGASKFGAGSKGGLNNNSNSWGFIANYTNRYLPNALRLTSSYMGLSVGGQASSCISFSDIINYGYGAAIVYGDYLSYAPSVIRWTYYQPNYNGFYIYAYTERVANLKIPTWTNANGQDDLIWYNATKQDNTVKGQKYNWVLWVPRSDHKNEIGKYSTHFYGYHADGRYDAKTGGYEPPKVPATRIVQTDSEGFWAYANIQAANSLSVPVWTDSGWQDDLIWYAAKQKDNTVDGVTYHWQVYVPFSEHKNEQGLYYIDYYASNDYSEKLCGASDRYTPLAILPTLKADSCDVYNGSSYEPDKCLGTSYGPLEDSFVVNTAYPQTGDILNFKVCFESVSGKVYPVKQEVTIGKQVFSRNTTSDDTDFPVILDNFAVDENMQNFNINARIDIYDEKYEAVKSKGGTTTFYVPIMPTVTPDHVRINDITNTYYGYADTQSTKCCLYYGQRIYTEYGFKLKNSWSCNFNLYATPLVWSDGNSYSASIACSGNDYDFERQNIELSNGKLYEGSGSMGIYTIDFDSTPELNGQMVYYCKTEWSDHAFGINEEYFYIPVIKADAELYGIVLYNEYGEEISPDRLMIGHTYTAYYQYRNNTRCKIFVDAYDSSHNKIGMFKIEPHGEITVEGETFTVTGYEDVLLWGGVYLENCGLHDTHFETNEKNNEMTLVCHVMPTLEIVSINPNADYRAGTEVINSVWVLNDGDTGFDPSDNITINFSMYVDGEKIDSASVDNAVVPPSDKNLYFAKWKVPEESDGKKATVKAVLCMDGIEIGTDQIENNIVAYEEYRTPDTKYEKDKPADFSIPESPKVDRQYATWWQYQYENGEYVKKSYGICCYATDYEKITPADNANYRFENYSYTMPSGYGLISSVEDVMAYVYGYSHPETNAFTKSQYVMSALPEFAYSKLKTLTNSGTKWIFPDADGYGNIHYIPVYYPNGEYVVKIIKSDFWTPSGMLTSVGCSKAINIENSVYDDWHIKHNRLGKEEN